MEFLTQQNRRVADRTVHEEAILATGKNVVVIGGGDTGSDCVGTSNRQNAKSVTQFELLPTPPQQRTEYMPWPTYPMILRTSSSHREGAERKWAIATKAFLGDGNGQLRAVKVVDLEWQMSSEGRPAQFVEIIETEREIPCELALLALGFLFPQHTGVIEELGIGITDRGNVTATEGSYQTNVAGVFSAGDMRRGQSLVVWAISEGRECARKVDEYLMGTSALATKDA